MKNYFLVLSSLAALLSARIEGDLAEYDFLKENCISSNDFPSSGLNGLGAGDLESPNNQASFSCPTITFNTFTFEDASNGVNFGANQNHLLVSENPIDQSQLNESDIDGESSFEFFFFTEVSPINNEKQIIFEISRSDNTIGVGDDWNLGEDYFFRVSMDSNEVFVEVLLLDGAQRERTLFFNNNNLKIGELNHLVIVLSPNIGVGGTDITLHLNEVTISQFLTDSNGVPLDSSQDLFIVLGGSFGIDASTEHTTAALDIHKLAIHSTALTQAQVDENREDSVVNSSPAAISKVFDHIEDGTTVINFDNTFFDFDNDILQISQQDVLSVRVLTDVELGALSVVPEATIALDGTITYNQDTANLDSEVDTLTFLIFQGGLNQDLFSAIQTITLNYVESNDDPVALETIFEIGELQTRTVQLRGNDPLDVGEGKNPDFFPTSFQITNVEIEQIDGVDVAKLVECDDLVTVLDEDSDPLTDVVSDNNDIFSTDICVIGGVFDGVSDALLGSLTVTFTVSDSAGGLSEESTTTITVLQALSAGCRFLNDNTQCETFAVESEITDANNRVEIPIVLFDSRCDGFDDVNDPNRDSNCECDVDELDCVPRVKEAVIILPIPNKETEGTIFYTNVNGVVELNENDFVEGIFVLPEESNNAIFFEAVDNYFNLSPFPTCLRGQDFIDNPERAQCVNILAPATIADDCLGKFCDSNSISTGVLYNEQTLVYGVCGDSDQIDSGCPIRLFTQLKIGNGFSDNDEEDGPTQLIWVQNEIEGDNFEFELPAEIGVTIDQGTSPNLNGQTFNFNDKENGARGIRLNIGINNGGSVQIPNFNEYIVNQDDRALLAYLNIDGSFGTGITDNGAGDGVIIGFAPDINEILKGLSIVVQEVETEMLVRVQEPAEPTVNTGQVLTRIDLDGSFGEDEDDLSFIEELTNSALFYIAAGTFLLICCFCVYKCFEKDTCNCVFVVKKTTYVAGKLKRSKRHQHIEDSSDDEKKSNESSSRRKKKKGGKGRKGRKKYDVVESNRSNRSEVTANNKKYNNKKKGPVKSLRNEGGRNGSGRDKSDKKPNRRMKEVKKPSSRRKKKDSHDS